MGDRLKIKDSLAGFVSVRCLPQARPMYILSKAETKATQKWR